MQKIGGSMTTIFKGIILITFLASSSKLLHRKIELQNPPATVAGAWLLERKIDNKANSLEHYHQQEGGKESINPPLPLHNWWPPLLHGKQQ